MYQINGTTTFLNLISKILKSPNILPQILKILNSILYTSYYYNREATNLIRLFNTNEIRAQRRNLREMVRILERKREGERRRK